MDLVLVRMLRRVGADEKEVCTSWLERTFLTDLARVLWQGS